MPATSADTKQNAPQENEVRASRKRQLAAGGDEERFELLRRFEADLPHIESVQDDSEPLNQATTIFRNLQDYISGVDRNSYAWEKMGQAQMRGILSQYNPQNERQSTAANEEEQ